MSRKIVIGLFALAIVVVIGGLLFRFALPGLSSARPQPPAVEIAVASWLLVHSVPPEQANRANPLQPNEAASRPARRSSSRIARSAMASTAAAAR
jgi:hypothetical protein